MYHLTIEDQVITGQLIKGASRILSINQSIRFGIKKKSAGEFAQQGCNVIRGILAKVGIIMPEWDDETAALCVTFFAKINGDERMYRAGKLAMQELEKAKSLKTSL
jgi:hypothetical protein